MMLMNLKQKTVIGDGLCSSISQDWLSQQRAQLSAMPTEILVQIASYLTITDILELAQCNQYLNHLSFSRAIWEGVSFQLDMAVTLPNTILGVADQLHLSREHQKRQLRQRIPESASIWHLRSTAMASQFLINLPPPSMQFLQRSSTTLRFQWIQTLKLNNITSFITDDFLRVLLPLLPRLVAVDFSSCSMLTDYSIYELVKHPERSQRLRSLKLKRCHGLTYQSLHYIAKYCQDLHELDLDGCGAVTDNGLMLLCSTPHNSNGQVKLPYTLRSLNLSNADYLMENVLCAFLRSFTAVSPDQSNLCEIELENTFCVTAACLQSIYSHVCMQNDEDGIDMVQSKKRSFNLKVKGCEQLLKIEVEQFRKRLLQEIAENPKFSNAFTGVSVQENCKLHDDSATSIRKYLDSILG
ncbi:hypothetical protein MP228_006602 [Amoeboaphelidium protococcarum]|nr:hypothetical protein MP228_006602 [Amoeboaphelidium protococcarum]